MTVELYVILKKLKEHSESTYKHSLRVAKLAKLFGQSLGLDKSVLEKLIIVGLLHDIGKLNIPKNILSKPGKLNIEEYNIIKMHTLYGIDLLLKNGFQDYEVLTAILCHHERIDGFGYPNRLSSDKIPYLAKIIAICDSYDAMMYNRPYRNAQSIEYIENELFKGIDNQFDKEYVLLFIDYLENNILQKRLLKV